MVSYVFWGRRVKQSLGGKTGNRPQNLSDLYALCSHQQLMDAVVIPILGGNQLLGNKGMSMVRWLFKILVSGFSPISVQNPRFQGCVARPQGFQGRFVWVLFAVF